MVHKTNRDYSTFKKQCHHHQGSVRTVRNSFCTLIVNDDDIRIREINFLNVTFAEKIMVLASVTLAHNANLFFFCRF